MSGPKELLVQKVIIRCMMILYAVCHFRPGNLRATQPLPLEELASITKDQGPRTEEVEARVGGSWGALVRPRG